MRSFSLFTLALALGLAAHAEVANAYTLNLYCQGTYYTTSYLWGSGSHYMTSMSQKSCGAAGIRYSVPVYVFNGYATRYVSNLGYSNNYAPVTYYYVPEYVNPCGSLDRGMVTFQSRDATTGALAVNAYPLVLPSGSMPSPSSTPVYQSQLTQIEYRREAANVSSNCSISIQ